MKLVPYVDSLVWSDDDLKYIDENYLKEMEN